MSTHQPMRGAMNKPLTDRSVGAMSADLALVHAAASCRLGQAVHRKLGLHLPLQRGLRVVQPPAVLVLEHLDVEVSVRLEEHGKLAGSFDAGYEEQA
jgi:hypothetical protein